MLVSNKKRLSKYLDGDDTPEAFLKRNHEVLEVVREFLRDEREMYVKSLTSVPVSSGEAYGVATSNIAGKIQLLDGLLLVLGETELK